MPFSPPGDLPDPVIKLGIFCIGRWVFFSFFFLFVFFTTETLGKSCPKSFKTKPEKIKLFKSNLNISQYNTQEYLLASKYPASSKVEFAVSAIQLKATSIHVYSYGYFMLMYDRNQTNIVKQLTFN